MSERTVTCTHHCRECKSHFTSLTAFDHHRGGRFQPMTRCCLWPEDVTDRDGNELLEAVEGRCALGIGPQTFGVSVWRVRGASERCSAVFEEAA